MIIFLTGASAVGKTSLVNQLTSELPGENFEFYQFDSIGIPDLEEMIAQYGSGAKWQEAKTQEWIDFLLSRPSDKTIIFEGQTNIDFIRSGFKKHAYQDYKIILMDCEVEEMNRRLIVERNQPELANEDMANWLKFLRRQAKEYALGIINTTHLSKKETVAVFINQL